MFALVPKMAARLERQGCDLTKVIVNDEHILPDPKFPTSPGIYGGFVFVHRQSGRQWKLDFWGWDNVWYDQRRNSHHDLQCSLQGADRDLILRLKRSDGYGHAFFSVDVYAFALANAGDSYQIVIEMSAILISIRPTGVTTKSSRLTGRLCEA